MDGWEIECVEANDPRAPLDPANVWFGTSTTTQSNAINTPHILHNMARTHWLVTEPHSNAR
jgi:hypothetical protein